MGKKIGVCPKCMRTRELTYHHIFPIRFFGKNDNKLAVCWECHVDVERILPDRKMNHDDYRQVHKNWLSGLKQLIR